MSPKRPGFTLFQLLVVLAVLAILFALFLPAIAKIRVSAARIQSQNNLRQIALATLNYESAYGVFPPGIDSKGFSTAALPGKGRRSAIPPSPGPCAPWPPAERMLTIKESPRGRSSRPWGRRAAS